MPLAGTIVVNGPSYALSTSSVWHEACPASKRFHNEDYARPSPALVQRARDCMTTYG